MSKIVHFFFNFFDQTYNGKITESLVIGIEKLSLQDNNTNYNLFLTVHQYTCGDTSGGNLFSIFKITAQIGTLDFSGMLLT